jgi:hypothetical protein
MKASWALTAKRFISDTMQLHFRRGSNFTIIVLQLGALLFCATEVWKAVSLWIETGSPEIQHNCGTRSGIICLLAEIGDGHFWLGLMCVSILYLARLIYLFSGRLVGDCVAAELLDDLLVLHPSFVSYPSLAQVKSIETVRISRVHLTFDPTEIAHEPEGLVWDYYKRSLVVEFKDSNGTSRKVRFDGNQIVGGRRQLVSISTELRCEIEKG